MHSLLSEILFSFTFVYLLFFFSLSAAAAGFPVFLYAFVVLRPLTATMLSFSCSVNAAANSFPSEGKTKRQQEEEANKKKMEWARRAVK